MLSILESIQAAQHNLALYAGQVEKKIWDIDVRLAVPKLDR